MRQVSTGIKPRNQRKLSNVLDLECSFGVNGVATAAFGEKAPLREGVEPLISGTPGVKVGDSTLKRLFILSIKILGLLTIF